MRGIYINDLEGSQGSQIIFYLSNSVVIVDKTDYLDIMLNLVDDTHKFGKINLENVGILGFAVSQEKLVENILRKLFTPNSASEETSKQVGN